MTTIAFTPRQRKTISRALTAAATAVVVTFFIVVLWALYKALQFTAPAIVPVIFGFFLALFFKPYYHWWLKLVRNPTLAMTLMLATVFVPLGCLCFYMGSVLIDQISNLLQQGPQLVGKVLDWFHVSFPKLQALLDHFGVPYERLGDLYTTYGTAAVKAGFGAFKCLSWMVSALVSMIFFVFFLMTKERRGGEIVSEMPFLKPTTREFLAEQIDTFVEILVNFFQRQVVICLVEGVMYGTGFMLVGLQYGFLIGFILGVLNLIPFLGSLVCLPVAMALAYFGASGSVTQLVLVLVVWGCGQLLDGYLITPKIQGSKTGLGYAAVIFSFFFWGTVLGPLLGMLLAIPLSAFCVVLWRALKSKYIRPFV